MGRDCQNASITMEYLAGQSSFEEAPAAFSEENVIPAEKRTFAPKLTTGQD